MIENSVLEALVPQLVEDIEKLIDKRHTHAQAVQLVMSSTKVSEHHFTHLEIDQLDTAVRISLQNRTCERMRSTPHTAGATMIAGGRIPPRSGRSRFSGRDLAAGAEAEERRDEVAAELSPLRVS